ncbi:MAG TPA: histidine phosphatase family protein [Bradyrhizobium sp.]|nr:histidine phosphatase family protein [Bradyrhizobium sp.]
MNATATPSRAFLFARHGATDWNRDGRIQGRTDNPINDEGIAQAFAIARRLRRFQIDQIVTSPLVRAVKTAEIIAAPSATPVTVDKDLIAFDYGNLEGQVITDTMRTHGLKSVQDFVSILPDSESWTSAADRVLGCVCRWVAAGAQGTVLFVSHDLMMQALSTKLCGRWFTNRYGTPYRFAPTEAGWVVDEIY